LGTSKRYPSSERHPDPAVNWHPWQIARPSEWLMENGWPPDPIAVVRRLEIPNGNHNITRFRVVTWAPTSEGRELIGYYERPEDAAVAAWEHRGDNHTYCQHR
jgi:hypothetical protein